LPWGQAATGVLYAGDRDRLNSLTLGGCQFMDMTEIEVYGRPS